ncbi:MAG TPA: 6-phosphogluconolactonase [Acidimicrobiales bacterium]|nr:6-phosphogluconolactonase [Acidimicrobiales bacterium]
MNGELVVVDDVPGAFTAEVVSAFARRPGEEFDIALSGGGTARSCYERLAADGAQAIDWLAVNFFWGDECCVPPDHQDSNERLAREALLERVGAANAVYPMRCDASLDAYQLHLGEVGQLDLVHLGMGRDGHTAGLFPGSPVLDADPGQLVAYSQDPNGLNKHRCMTLTYAGIARARLVIFTVAGEAKREAMQAVYAGADLPAARVRAGRVLWLVSPDAAPAIVSS